MACVCHSELTSPPKYGNLNFNNNGFHYFGLGKESPPQALGYSEQLFTCHKKVFWAIIFCTIWNRLPLPNMVFTYLMQGKKLVIESLKQYSTDTTNSLDFANVTLGFMYNVNNEAQKIILSVMSPFLRNLFF